MISWWDVDTSRADSSYTFEYGIEGSDSFVSLNVTDREEVPEKANTFRYTILVTGLKAGKSYEGFIKTGELQQKVFFKTLPSRLWRNQLKICSVSDIHIDRSWDTGLTTYGIMTNASEMSQIRAHNPDIFVIAGDVATSFAAGSVAIRTQSFETFFRDHIQILNTVGSELRLIPILYQPGNHEAGFRSISEEPADASGSLLVVFMQNIYTTPPVSQLCGLIKVGNICNIFALDYFSSELLEQGDMIANNQKRDVLCNLYITHQPLLRGANRSSTDDEASDYLQQKWLYPALRSKIPAIGISGHIHVRKRSVPVKLQTNDPGGSNKIAVENSGGFIVEAGEDEPAYIEFGDGYNTFRQIVSRWYIDESASRNINLRSFNIITITPTSITHTLQQFSNQGIVNTPIKSTKAIINSVALLV